MTELPISDPLREQLIEAARQFTGEARPLKDLLLSIARDIERAASEPLEIFPVCHHSPASAFHMVRRLTESAPKVIYMEACEDLYTVVRYLQDCKLPVALQGFAGKSEGFPEAWNPLSVILPLTEASAEYQAIAYALQHPDDTELVFVDRAVDYVFQWMPQEEDALDRQIPGKEELLSEEAGMHGTAIGLQLGDIEPTFEQFLEFLLRNACVRHFAEWWDQYVEQAVISSDYQTYRQVMFMIGSLFRRLGKKDDDIETDRLRERYMWTRIKQHIAAWKINPRDAIYICGAAHTASDVEEFGLDNDKMWDIPGPTGTEWIYGIIPSSFAAIEHQFASPAGTVSMAEETWKKSLTAGKLRPFKLENTKKKRKPAARPGSPDQADSPIHGFLTRAPVLVHADETRLLRRCADIVALARKNGYLASTADSIAIYETSVLLANLRNRPHPSPYDFQDAAITCLEKDRTPKKRDVRQLCQILFEGNRIGTVGYVSLPPLVQNLYDRLAPLDISLTAKTIQRALMDFRSRPELAGCSDVLWRLNYLLGDHVVQPIMGERTLGHTRVQESWDIRIGKYQGSVIQLGYEGVTLEQVLEQRIRQRAFEGEAGAGITLGVAEDSILYLDSPRLTRELGEHAMHLLLDETGAGDAPEIFARIRRLVHYYRSARTGLPDWIQHFVATGYSHYATLLPNAFEDRGTSPEQIAGMLGFIFTLESLALSMGCQRSQLMIGVQQAGQTADDPAKIGLLWTSEWLLGLRSIEEIREFFNRMFSNPLMMPAFPDYLNGFMLSMNFTQRIAPFVVELFSRVFASAPDARLMTWLPELILRLRSCGPLLQILIKEASSSFPSALQDFETWHEPWITGQISEEQEEESACEELSDVEEIVRSLVLEAPETMNVIAKLLADKS
ncbi:DUF5682 family protein [Desulfococcaceae bacterium HSG8]|nr:DUF5682 family protein [Desulfococcaceae bacterium HSG8]